MERKYPGTDSARRDKLEKFWDKLFGYRHSIMIVTRFYENVARHKVVGRELAPREKEQHAVLEFDPHSPQDLLVAWVWNLSPRADQAPS